MAGSTLLRALNVPFQVIGESRRIVKRACHQSAIEALRGLQSAIEALRGLPRQRSAWIDKESVNSRHLPFYRPRRNCYGIPLASLPESSLGPALASIEFTFVVGCVRGSVPQNHAQPFGDSRGDRVTNQAPPTPPFRNLLSRRGP